MSFLMLAAAAALATSPLPAAETQPAQPQRASPSAWDAQDRDIERALLELHRTHPERTVCVERTLTGSRQRRAICSTVARWFGARLPQEIAAGDPPFQLVEEIKRQRSKARLRRGQGG